MAPRSDPWIWMPEAPRQGFTLHTAAALGALPGGGQLIPAPRPHWLGSWQQFSLSPWAPHPPSSLFGTIVSGGYQDLHFQLVWEFGE